MGTPNDLLGVTDLIALHCAFTDESVQIVNAEFLQQVKPLQIAGKQCGWRYVKKLSPYCSLTFWVKGRWTIWEPRQRKRTSRKWQILIFQVENKERGQDEF